MSGIMLYNNQEDGIKTIFIKVLLKQNLLNKNQFEEVFGLKRENAKKEVLKITFRLITSPIWWISEGAIFSSKMKKLKKTETETSFLYQRSANLESAEERYVWWYDSYCKKFGDPKKAAAFAYTRAYCDVELESETCDGALAELLNNEALKGDEKKRPYEHLLRRGEGEKASNQYKAQCLLLAASLNCSDSPYRYDILSSSMKNEK